jgi:pimeloyl-[acyl-carrier protein] synthase
MPTAVEELLRFSPTIMMAHRIAHEDMEIGQAQVKKGEHVVLVLGAANRDSERFGRPDELDLLRSPSPHVTFGQGVHYCLGAHLARMELQILLTALLRRLPGLRLRPGALDWEQSFMVRGLRSLQVEF